jgi:hypothetical protein
MSEEVERGNDSVLKWGSHGARSAGGYLGANRKQFQDDSSLFPAFAGDWVQP